jgi:hypothetical protein
MAKMDMLVKTIDALRPKLDGWRKKPLNETQTRISVIDPLLEALGWNTRDPDVVQAEYATVDGKSADYVMLIGGKPVLVVEAKALSDPLKDVKAVTQVVGYAANAGIEWCALTNGMQWKVYRSFEKSPAPQKKMLEVSLDPMASEGISSEQLALKLGLLSPNQLAAGSLDNVALDSVVRKAMDTLARNPPKDFLRLIRSATEDKSLSLDRIKEALGRVWFLVSPANETPPVPKKGESESSHTEEKLLRDRPENIIGVYREIESLCSRLATPKLTRRFQKGYFAYSVPGKKTVLWGRPTSDYVRIEFIRIRFRNVETPPPFSYESKCDGRLNLRIGNLDQLRDCENLFRMAFES